MSQFERLYTFLEKWREHDAGLSARARLGLPPQFKTHGFKLGGFIQAGLDKPEYMPIIVDYLVRGKRSSTDLAAMYRGWMRKGHDGEAARIVELAPRVLSVLEREFLVAWLDHERLLNVTDVVVAWKSLTQRDDTPWQNARHLHDVIRGLHDAGQEEALLETYGGDSSFYALGIEGMDLLFDLELNRAVNRLMGPLTKRKWSNDDWRHLQYRVAVRDNPGKRLLRRG